MSLYQQLQKDLIQALRANDQRSKEALRFLLAAIKNKQIDKQSDLTDQEVIGIIRKQIKKETEELEFNRQAGRKSQAKDGLAKIELLKNYLPVELGDEKVKEKILQALKSQDLSPKNFGPLMGRLVKDLGQEIPNSQLARVLKQVLNG